jgi:methylated-DNA-[protein]-cysteine S-methyltransferase
MSISLSMFPSELGWFGIAGRNGRLIGLCFGHAAAADVERRMAAEFGSGLDVEDWAPQLRERLQAYTEGAADDFQDIEVDLHELTPFQQRVVRRLRQVRYGQTVSYKKLAQQAGAPGSARAVGRVMATNRIPIILPCHRVVASGGGLGGFSAPQGISMKLRLLQLEGAGGFESGFTIEHQPALTACVG